MRLREANENLEKWDHVIHHVTLWLVAIAFATEIGGSQLPQAGKAAEWVRHALHFLHYTALGVVIVNICLFLLFRRNIGGYIASILQRRSISPHPYLVNLELRPFNYEALSISSQDFRYVADTTSFMAQALFQMNAQCFEGTAFEMTPEEIVERNSSLMRKNGKIFMLVQNPLRETQEDEFIGFSCVLPLNSVGADIYLNGLIKDRDIRASMLCREGEPCDVILVFAIALKHDYRRVRGLASQYYPFLLRCTEHHIRTIATVHPGAPSVTVWVQAEHPKLTQHLEERGFVRTEGRKSADKFELYHRSLEIVRPKQTRKRKKVDTDRAIV